MRSSPDWIRFVATLADQQADDEAKRPTRDLASHALEDGLREFARSIRALADVVDMADTLLVTIWQGAERRTPE